MKYDQNVIIIAIPHVGIYNSNVSMNNKMEKKDWHCK